MTTKKTDSVDGIIVGASIICDIFGLSARTLRELAQMQVIDKYKNGAYELIPTIKKYITYLKTKSGNIDAKSSEQIYLIERTRHEKAKREIAEMELAQMKGIMHKADDVERVMNDMLSAFRAKILSLPTKVAPLLVAYNDIATIQDIIQKEVHEALSELSNYDPELFYGESYIQICSEADDNVSEHKENN